MESQVIAAIRNFALEARGLLEKEVQEQLEGIYGLLPNGRFEPAEKYPAITTLPAAKETRSALEQYFLDEETAGVDRKAARSKLVKEAAFTWLNRFVAFKMMEARGLIRETVTRLSDSNAFKHWLVEPGNQDDYAKYELGDLPVNALGEGPRHQAYRHFISSQCGKLAEEIRVLFDPDNLAGRLFPRPGTLASLSERLNSNEMKEAWAPGNEETIGWIYQGFNSRELEEAFRDARVSGKKFEADDIPAVSQLFTPRWIVRYLVENTLGRLWIEMHPDSRLAQELDYLVPMQSARTEPVRLAKEITFLDPACGTMHFGLVAFDLFVRMYEEEIERAGQDGWPSAPSAKGNADIPASIIAHNIHGVDIDLRAVQLSALGLYLKAKSLNPQARIADSRLACANVHMLDGRQFDEFIQETGLKHPIYSRILKALHDRLKDSEQLGSLLKLDEDIRLLVGQERTQYAQQGRQPDLFGWSEDQFETEAGRREFWEVLERQIEQALNEFAKIQAQGGSSHSVFVDETVKGMRLLEILGDKYDVVVTNPPYISNRKMNTTLKALVGQEYRAGKMDLYAAFIQRCCLLAREGGRVGMLSMHSFMFISSYQSLRDWLRHRICVESLVHTGPGLFDVGNPGTLQTAAYVLRSEPDSKLRERANGLYFRLIKELDGDSKRLRFAAAVDRVKASHDDPLVFRYRQRDFDAIPGGPWVYWITENIRLWFQTMPPLREFVTPWVGLQTSDNVRFLRFWWEIGYGKIGRGIESAKEAKQSNARWFPHVKGGQFCKWHGNQDFVINWFHDGFEMKAFADHLKQHADSFRGNSALRDFPYYFKSGITWSHTSSVGLSVRELPKGFICNVESVAAYSDSDDWTLLAAMAILNSRVGTFITSQLNPTLHYGTREIGDHPWPQSALSKRPAALLSMVEEAIRLHRSFQEEDETSWDFVGPAFWNDFMGSHEARQTDLSQIEAQIDDEVVRLYALGDRDLEAIQNEAPLLFDLEAEVSDPSGPDMAQDGPFGTRIRRGDGKRQLAVAWISYAAGIALSRFKPGAEDVPGSGRFSDHISSALRTISRKSGVLVMDEGHPDDLPSRVFEALTIMLGEKDVVEVVKTATGKDGAAEELLRHYLERDFFKLHIQQYRKRPVYWFLQSPKKKYGVWVFHERLTKDTLFRIRTDYVEPKLNLLEGRVSDLRKKKESAGGPEKRRLEKEIASLEDLGADIREFSKRIKFVSEECCYIPRIDDGVLWNMAPLWELIPSWQAEPKKAWAELESGKYDWAHQAMDHWPARVREKCKTNKSYAIAHGLLELYEEPTKGKRK